MSKKNLNVDMNNLPGTKLTIFDTSNLFDFGYQEDSISPIDSFLQKGIELNKLIKTTNPDPILVSLVLLGYVSAVESYYRAIIRGLILIDPITSKNCEDKRLSFAAAISSKNKKMLPEALLEETTFIGKNYIVEAFKEFLKIGINPENISPEFNKALDDYTKVCHLRNCIVHRSGKLGSKNAIALGLAKHKKGIEKPVLFDYLSLQNMIDVCQDTIKLSNHFLSRRILERLIIDNKNTKRTDIIWKWNYIKDKRVFDEYFNLFYSTIEKPSSINNSQDAYTLYKLFYDSLQK
jgi:hypothetical protein